MATPVGAQIDQLALRQAGNAREAGGMRQARDVLLGVGQRALDAGQLARSTKHRSAGLERRSGPRGELADVRGAEPLARHLDGVIRRSLLGGRVGARGRLGHHLDDADRRLRLRLGARVGIDLGPHLGRERRKEPDEKEPLQHAAGRIRTKPGSARAFVRSPECALSSGPLGPMLGACSGTPSKRRRSISAGSS